MWEYFKNCLRRNNRFFFEHPHLPVLEAEFKRNVCKLSEGTDLYRANTIHHPVVYDNINYFDYDIMDINMMYFLMGESTFEKGKAYSMVYDNRYRHLLCKHVDFAEQREFRIIMLDEKIVEPYSYPFVFESKYEIVDLNNFFAGIDVRL